MKRALVAALVEALGACAQARVWAPAFFADWDGAWKDMLTHHPGWCYWLIHRLGELGHLDGDTFVRTQLAVMDRMACCLPYTLHEDTHAVRAALDRWCADPSTRAALVALPYPKAGPSGAASCYSDALGALARTLREGLYVGSTVALTGVEAALANGGDRAAYYTVLAELYKEPVFDALARVAP